MIGLDKPTNSVSLRFSSNSDWRKWIADWSEVRFWRPLFVHFVLVSLLLLAATLLFRNTNLDILICGLFYEGLGAGWTYINAEPWLTLYTYGPLPGLALGVGGLIVGLYAMIRSRESRLARAGLFLATFLALGPGLLVNGILKPGWGRPRPNQVEQFGGPHEFVRVGNWSYTSDTKSFPCGHASMGFFLIAPAFMLRRKHWGWILLFLCLGLAAGSLMGIGRVVQGRHFPSDVIWSGGAVYLCGLLLSYLFRYRGEPETSVPDESAYMVISFPNAHSKISAPSSKEAETSLKAA